MNMSVFLVCHCLLSRDDPFFKRMNFRKKFAIKQTPFKYECENFIENTRYSIYSKRICPTFCPSSRMILMVTESKCSRPIDIY